MFWLDNARAAGRGLPRFRQPQRRLRPPRPTNDRRCPLGGAPPVLPPCAGRSRTTARCGSAHRWARAAAGGSSRRARAHRAPLSPNCRWLHRVRTHRKPGCSLRRRQRPCDPPSARVAVAGATRTARGHDQRRRQARTPKTTQPPLARVNTYIRSAPRSSGGARRRRGASAIASVRVTDRASERRSGSAPSRSDPRARTH